MKILIVEDDRALNNGIALSLQGEEILQAFSIAQARRMFDESIDLIILDINLPDGSGLDYCREVRQGSKTAIIFLTANDMEIDIVTGLEMGADDYITKPFNPLEVIARVKTQLRRYHRYNGGGAPQEGLPGEELEIRGLAMNQRTHCCSLYGKELSLTPLEFSVLWYLCSHQGEVVPSEELFEAVWKEKYLDHNNTVMAHIGRIREKLKDSYRNQKFIKTVWGIGYTIEK